MLVELTIENFAIIDHLHLNFKPGLITFTGETGAGKSIIIDALETLLGGRADAAMVRSGADRANIEGVFRITDRTKEPVQEILRREDLLDDPEWFTLGREIRANGRNTARINGRSVSVGLLREIGEFLVDVHGQSEHLSLLRVNQHLHLLDRYATSKLMETPDRTGQKPGLSDVLKKYQAIYRKLEENQRKLDELRLSERDAARRTDMLTFQIQEIEAARLKIGEEADLQEERNRLANAESLASLAQEALMVLDEGTPEIPAVTDLFGSALKALEGLARIDSTQSRQFEETQSLFFRLADVVRDLRAYLDAVEFNPRRLDQVEERLLLIHNLKRKYGDTVELVLAFAVRAHEELNTITHAEERINELELERAELFKKLAVEGHALTQYRKSAAEHLSKAIEGELKDLNMDGALFKVSFQQQLDPQGVQLSDGSRIAYSIHGFERVEFLIAPNPGEGLKPLVKIASGGETSRLMLALKNVLASADEVPTLIFDEIDQGIGGRVGAIVGEKLWALSRDHQVMCITHLPQLAVFGEQHFGVQKAVESGRTITVVKLIEGQERLSELAQMMGEISEGTLKSAREMVLMAQNRKIPSL
jgi:DNA repair protein RecN (Recombination protein N)